MLLENLLKMIALDPLHIDCPYEEENSINQSATTANPCENTRLKELSRDIREKKSKASMCRELLKELTNLTYNVNCLDALQILQDQLTHSLESLSKTIPHSNGLLIEHRPSNKRQENEKPIYDAIPRPKKRKIVTSGRVGRGNERKKESIAINVPTFVKKETKHNIIEEPVPVDDHCLYDVPIDLTDCDHMDSDSDITITNVLPSREVEQSKQPLISKQEMDAIRNGNMLTDESINIGQQLLKERFPNLDGFQDTLLGETNAFSTIKRHKKFVQILHTGNMHWICIANTYKGKYQNDVCHVYDSLNNGKLSSNNKRHIASLCQYEGEKFTINIQPVQQQDNGVDCGLYAVAFATSLAFGDDPVKLFYNKYNLQTHFINCLLNKNMTKFPGVSKSEVNTKVCRSKTIPLEIYCVCRMNFNQDDDIMAQCDKCHRWYHQQCVKIPRMIFTKKSAIFICTSCKK